MEAIATIGVPEALASRLHALENERERWQATSNQMTESYKMPEVPNLRAMYKRVSLRLAESVQSGVAKARFVVSGILGGVRLDKLGKEVRAEMKTGQSLMAIDQFYKDGCGGRI